LTGYETEVELRRRLFHWALQDAIHETHADYPLTRTIRSEFARAFLQYVEEKDAGERLRIAEAGVRSRFQAMLDEEHIAMWAEPMIWFQKEVRPQIGGRSLWLARDLATERRGELINKNELLADAVQSLVPVLGGDVQHVGQKSAVFKTPVGGWTIQTVVSLHPKRSWPEIDCKHTILGHPSEVLRIPDPLGRTMDLFSLRGFNGTSWAVTDEGYVDEFAASLSAVCGHFLEEMHTVLTSLEPARY